MFEQALIVVATVLSLFLWIWPTRKRNRLIGFFYDRYRHRVAKLGLNHAAWTMFSSGANRNHVLTVKYLKGVEEIIVRDPWRLGGVWGDLIDERLRRILLAVIRSDTGPATKSALAQSLARWSIDRINDPGWHAGTVVVSQEIFERDDQGGVKVTERTVKTLKFEKTNDTIRFL